MTEEVPLAVVLSAVSTLALAVEMGATDDRGAALWRELARVLEIDPGVPARSVPGLADRVLLARPERAAVVARMMGLGRREHPSDAS